MIHESMAVKKTIPGRRNGMVLGPMKSPALGKFVLENRSDVKIKSAQALGWERRDRDNSCNQKCH